MPDGMTGGGKMSAYLRNLAARAGTPKQVAIGFPEGGTEADGTSLPMVAAMNEFGAPSRGQPPRPFFRGMIARHKGEWAGELGRVLVYEDYNASVALTAMGQRIQGELQDSIRDLTTPPLAASTIRRKGSAKPLVDTGTMLQGVQYTVSDSE